MNEPLDFERAAIERDRDLAWELFEAQPNHPRIPQITQSVLARVPEFTGMSILLARHRTACGEYDEARQLLQDLIGRRDRQYLNALRDLRDLEYTTRQYVEYLRLAELVLREAPEADWRDRMHLGAATAYTVDSEAGWALIDDAVESCARTDPDIYPGALALRVAQLLTSGASPDRVLVAAQHAIEVDPTDLEIATILAYAYLSDYRPEKATEILLRVLREDPTDKFAQGGMKFVEAFSVPLKNDTVTMDDLRTTGMGSIAWREVQHWLFRTGVDKALLALEAVIPEDLTRALRPPLSQEEAQQSSGHYDVYNWHDGQLPGTGHLWREGQSFRLMSAAEISETDDAIEQHPQDWPEWGEDTMGYFKILFTDDAGAYLIEGPGGRLYRRAAGESDQEVAASLSDWLWDRVAAFGGDDPRPGKAGRPQELEHATDRRSTPSDVDSVHDRDACAYIHVSRHQWSRGGPADQPS